MKFIKINAEIADDDRCQMKVLSLKKYQIEDGSWKTEACIMLHDSVSKKVFKLNGKMLDEVPIEMIRLRVCRFANKNGGCRNKENCQFFHPETVNDGDAGVARSTTSSKSKSMCWYDNEKRCPFGAKCHFQHKVDVNEAGSSDGDQSNNSEKN